VAIATVIGASLKVRPGLSMHKPGRFCEPGQDHEGFDNIARLSDEIAARSYSASSLIGMLTTILMAVLGRRAANAGLNAGGFSRLLAGQSNNIVAAMPSASKDLTFNVLKTKGYNYLPLPLPKFRVTDSNTQWD
jgi:hypothetical protein